MLGDGEEEVVAGEVLLPGLRRGGEEGAGTVAVPFPNRGGSGGVCSGGEVVLKLQPWWCEFS